MADAPVTVPVKLVQDGNIGIHTDAAHSVSIQITHANELANQVLDTIVPHLHCLTISLIVAAVFLAIILTVIAVSMVISAIALHKIAKQGEIELELEELN